MERYLVTISNVFSDPSVKYYVFFEEYSKLLDYLDRISTKFPHAKIEIEIEELNNGK